MFLQKKLETRPSFSSSVASVGLRLVVFFYDFDNIDKWWFYCEVDRSFPFMLFVWYSIEGFGCASHSWSTKARRMSPASTYLLLIFQPLLLLLPGLYMIFQGFLCFSCSSMTLFDCCHCFIVCRTNTWCKKFQVLADSWWVVFPCCLTYWSILWEILSKYPFSVGFSKLNALVELKDFVPINVEWFWNWVNWWRCLHHWLIPFYRGSLDRGTHWII